MEYTLKTYGWNADFICRTLSEYEVNFIKRFMDENGINNVGEIRFDLDGLESFDVWDGNILQMTKPFDNGTMLFEVLDDNGILILEFGIEDIVKNENVEPDDYEAFPSENSSVYFSVDEFKGGIFSYEFESDDIPKLDDFTYLKSSVLTPDVEWGIIDKIYYRGNELEVLDHLDCLGKSATVKIYHWEE